MKENNLNTILYIGNYHTERIVKERSLPGYNVAGSNRMKRISETLISVGKNIVILSSATSLNMKWTGKFIHSAKVTRDKAILVLYCTAIGLPIVGWLLEPIFLLIFLRKALNKYKPNTVVLYNYSPSLVFAIIYIKILRFSDSIKIIHNVEDIPFPKLSDWLPNAEVNPWQQIIFSLCHRMINHLASATLVPTQRFLKYCSKSKPYTTITGFSCANISSVNIDGKISSRILLERPLKVLFAGKIEFEYGISDLINTLENLKDNASFTNKNITVDICGSGSKSKWLHQHLLNKKYTNVTYHGFVTSEKYANLLSNADVCVSLQKSDGRYSSYKVPSKVYEYLSYGKMVVSTDVGDLSFLPSEVIFLLKEKSVQTIDLQLSTLLDNLIANPSIVISYSTSAFKYSLNEFDVTKNAYKILNLVS